MDNLNFGSYIVDRVHTLEGTNQMPKVVATHPSGSSVEVYLQGAHVTSWKTITGEELLFLSKKAYFQLDKPIRGGIPIVFPQFSNQGPLPQHGIVRARQWELVHAEVQDSDTTVVHFEIRHNPQTLEVWQHKFELHLEVLLNAYELALRLHVKNTDSRDFDFQAAFHTYFRVAEITKTKVLGLSGTEFLDALRGYVRETERRSAINFDQETDRIYVNTRDELFIEDAGNNRRITIVKENMPDVVVWNPWVEKSRRMPDFEDNEFHQMVCVETGVIEKPIHLPPMSKWTGFTKFSYQNLNTI